LFFKHFAKIVEYYKSVNYLFNAAVYGYRATLSASLF